MTKKKSTTAAASKTATPPVPPVDPAKTVIEKTDAEKAAETAAATAQTGAAEVKTGDAEKANEADTAAQTSETAEIKSGAGHGLTSEILSGGNQTPKTGDAASETGEGDDDDDDDDETVKSGFQKLTIQALCDNGEPFCGSYRSLKFDGEGKAEVTIADKESLEKLRDEYPTLEIKQA